MLLGITVVCTLVSLPAVTAAAQHHKDQPATSGEGAPAALGCVTSSAGLHDLLDSALVTLPRVLMPAAPAGSAKRAGNSFRYDSLPSRFRSRQYKVCRPSKDQIVEFLRALHHARSGKANQLATLCNDSQSVADIETNIRFIG